MIGRRYDVRAAAPDSPCVSQGAERSRWDDTTVGLARSIRRGHFRVPLTDIRRRCALGLRSFSSHLPDATRRGSSPVHPRHRREPRLRDGILWILLFGVIHVERRSCRWRRRWRLSMIASAISTVLECPATCASSSPRPRSRGHGGCATPSGTDVEAVAVTDAGDSQPSRRGYSCSIWRSLLSEWMSDPPPREARREADVLSLLSDRQAELVVGDDQLHRVGARRRSARATPWRAEWRCRRSGRDRRCTGRYRSSRRAALERPLEPCCRAYRRTPRQDRRRGRGTRPRSWSAPPARGRTPRSGRCPRRSPGPRAQTASRPGRDGSARG